MGAYLELIWVGDTPYLVYKNAQTNWKFRRQKLTPRELSAYEDLLDAQSEQMDDLLSGFMCIEESWEC